MPISSDALIKDEAKNVLVDNLELVLEKDSNVEEKLSKVKGLMT